MQSWSPAVTLGQFGVVAFVVSGDVPVTQIAVDLIGDGLAAPVQLHGDDLRPVVALRFQPALAGTFGLELRAVDVCGRVGLTGLRRDVVVQ